MYGADEPWLWRGQARAAYNLEPSLHTRVRVRATLDDEHVKSFSSSLLDAARRASLDVHEGARLPDIPLLALLQHHGAATALLDISLDPLVGLYMATVSPNPEDEAVDGALFAIRRPEREITDFDSRPFAEIYDWLRNDVVLYSAPDVSERLRIQRGHFLLGPVSTTDARVTIPLTLDTALIGNTWLRRRMDARGSTTPPPLATSDIAVFRVTARFKLQLRRWLEERSGLTPDFIYPTPWHQPHLDRFARSHGRNASF